MRIVRAFDKSGRGPGLLIQAVDANHLKGIDDHLRRVQISLLLLLDKPALLLFLLCLLYFR